MIGPFTISKKYLDWNMVKVDILKQFMLAFCLEKQRAPFFAFPSPSLLHQAII